MNIKGTKSEKNVIAAFAGESQARNKYAYFAMQAKKEGNNEAAELFEKMAENEKEHAKIWFKILYDNIEDTIKNLQASANAENEEWRIMYPEFAKQAREDGFEALAAKFERIAAIENDHERRFLELLLKQTSNENQVRESNVSNKFYRCIVCGNLEEYKLDVCPVCEAINSFELIKKN